MYALGKKPHVPDDRDFRYKTLLAPALPIPPSRFGHGLIFKEWGMLGNDTVGDCVFAGGAHETMLWTKLGGHFASFNTLGVLQDYSAVTGYSVVDPDSDQGTVVRDALKYRQKAGLLDGASRRHKIGAYAALTAGDWDELMQAVYIFGAVGIGIEFPDSAMEQHFNGEIWDVVDGATIEGGHYVPVVGRNARSSGGCITWGRRQGFTRDFYETYCDEAWVMVSEEELRNGKNERGFDLAALKAALVQL